MKGDGSDHSGRRNRLRYKAAKYGLSGIADRELIELVLYGTVPRVDTGETADALIERFGSPLGVLTAEKHELTAVYGVGEASADAIHTLCVNMSETLANKALSSSLPPSEKLALFARHKLMPMPLDTMLVMCIGRSENIADTLILYPHSARSESDIASEIVGACAAAKTKSAAIAHTHGRYGTAPSDDDIASTVILYRLLKKQGITLKAHIITSKLDASDILPSCIDMTDKVK